MSTMQGDTNLRKPTKLTCAVAGGISGTLTRFICQPIDVIKIRFQLQVEPIRKKNVESKYRGIGQAALLIAKEEGIQALWKGHVPAQILSFAYGIVQFGMYEALKEKAGEFNSMYSESLVNFVCGSLSGCAATLISFPFDVIRTRLVAQSSEKPLYNNMRTAFVHIYVNEGSFALWKGITPTLIQSAPFAGIQFASYKFFKSIFVHTSWLGEKNETEGTLFVSGSAFAGALAGLSSKTIIYPLDLARKRMQIQGFQDARKGFGKAFYCTGLISCLITTARGENFVGLFKGLSPSLMKAILTNSLIFAIYEKSCQVLSEIPEM